MLFKSLSAAVFGIDAYLVEVEVDVGSGNLHDFNVVGLPDVAVKESRERIKAALKNCGYDFPAPQSVTINLAPADIRKEGSAFDLPMALGILGCVGTFFGKALNGFVFLGELSLDGGVRAVRGALSGWPVPVATTSPSWARPAVASPCSPSPPPPPPRRCLWKRPSKPRAFTASPACWKTHAAWWARGPFALRTTPSATQD